MELRWINVSEALAEQLPPLTAHAAAVEADRCLYCYDAPCTHACPTHIDIPRFIKKIATNNLRGSAATILDSNLLGATCARVCPVQELCEGACVLGSEHKPIAIGRLQRHAMDHARDAGQYPLVTAKATGQKVVVVGAGPAGLSCAGELARLGHSVTLLEQRPLAGGLSTYGIIGLREPVRVALDEARMIAAMGVEIQTGVTLGVEWTLPELQAQFEAVVLAVGLGRTPALNISGEEAILDGLQFIESSKLAVLGRERLKVSREVIVIGAGNTAVDCATIAKRLGAEHVTIVYRRTDREMTCYEHEFEFAKREGIEFRFLCQPTSVLLQGSNPVGMECRQMKLGTPDASGRPAPVPVEGSEFILAADQIIKAIGQVKPAIAAMLGLATVNGWIAVDQDFQTSIAGVYAVGDCIRAKGAASTVMAVQDGKLAAKAIHSKLVAEMAEVR